jgi:predicted pyridoxine 5'-phosphate oxidase superfamily flavin-nucleotide-binding protein
MPPLPEKVSRAWENRSGPIVFSTVNEEVVPNAIYASCVSKYSTDTIVIANNYFHKTLKNIRSGSKGSILFIAEGWTSYQIKGSIEYYTEGPIYEDMKRWNPKHRPGHGSAALKVEEVYRGAKRL